MEVEEADRHRGTVVLLLAKAPLDRAPLGTMRIQTNAYGPLAVELSVTLPSNLGTKRLLAEATRLGVASGMVGRVVKVALCKALWMFCEQHGIDYMVITARAPLNREYEAMLFKDVFGGGEFLPMAHVGGLPYRVLAKDVWRLRVNVGRTRVIRCWTSHGSTRNTRTSIWLEIYLFSGKRFDAQKLR